MTVRHPTSWRAVTAAVRLASRPSSPAPMRLQADPARDSHPAPARRAGPSSRSPSCRSGPRSGRSCARAVLRVHMNDPAGQACVAVGIRRFAQHVHVGRIPDHPKRGMVEQLENLRGLGAGADVAAVLVLEADREPASRASSARCAAPRRCGRGSGPGVGAPVGEDADDGARRSVRHLEGPLRQAWLILEHVARAEHSCWTRGSSGGPSGRTHLSTGDAIETTAMPRRSTAERTRAISSSVSSMMLWPPTIRSSAPVMPTLRHRVQRDVEVGRETRR